MTHFKCISQVIIKWVTSMWDPLYLKHNSSPTSKTCHQQNLSHHFVFIANIFNMRASALQWPKSKILSWYSESAHPNPPCPKFEKKNWNIKNPLTMKYRINRCLLVGDWFSILSSGTPFPNEVRGGPNFDPVKYVKELNHVEHMHADSILIHPITLRN